jgi:nucleoside-diphosphate-sugar epimerase
MRHALVTGASGFIGRVLCRRLIDLGVQVCALQRHAAAGPWHDCVCVDLAAAAPAPDMLAGVDTVFHLAGDAHAHDLGDAAARHRAVSVDGTRRLLEACGESVERVVFASSVKAMGERTPAQCLDEDAPARPQSAYGHARREAEELILASAARRHTAVVRLPLVYGPGVRGNLHAMLRAVASGRMPLLPEFANRRSLVHVEDASEALIAAACTAAARGRVYLISDGQCYSSRQIQCLMYAAAGRRTPLLRVPRWLLRLVAGCGDELAALGAARVPFDSERLSRLADDACFDCTRARRELGYTPRYTLGDALPAMFAALDQGASP